MQFTKLPQQLIFTIKLLTLGKNRLWVLLVHFKFCYIDYITTYLFKRKTETARNSICTCTEIAVKLLKQ